MIHDNLVSGQFLLDLKNDRSSLLPGAGAIQPPHASLSGHILPHPSLSHHQHSQLQQASHNTSFPVTGPIPNLDLYSAYAYQQQLQQHLLNAAAVAALPLPPPNLIAPTLPSSITTPVDLHRAKPTSSIEVLDLSRRCDSIEINPKTPSPYLTPSSVESGSPAGSPANVPLISSVNGTAVGTAPAVTNASAFAQAAIQHQISAARSVVPFPAHPSKTAANASNGSCPTTSAATTTLFYPPILPYLSGPVMSTAAETSAANGLSGIQPGESLKQSVSPSSASPTSTTALSTIGSSVGVVNSGVSPLSVLDSKLTRPFKAYPRDPLVIAANFAATDVLLDNPRVERYTEYRKRVLEQIRNTNGGSRTVSNPKMRRTNLKNTSVADETSSNHSENDERHNTDHESSDTDSNKSVNILNNNNDDNDDIKMEVNSSNENNVTTTTSMATSCIPSTTSSVLTTTTTTTTTTMTMTASTSSSASTSCDSLNTVQGHDQQSLLAAGNNGIIKDAAYYERRRKNNAAAKKSRDRRRIKEDEIAIRAAYLERQNIELLCQIDALKAQLAAYTSKIVS